MARLIPIYPKEGQLFEPDYFREPTEDEKVNAKTLGPQFWRRCPECGQQVPLHQSMTDHLWGRHTDEGYEQSYAAKSMRASAARYPRYRAGS